MLSTPIQQIGTPPNPPNEDLVFQAFTAAEGDVDLAAEMLNVPKATVIATLSNNFTRLQTLLRSFLLINLFSTIQNMSMILTEKLPKLEPGDLAKAYTQVANQITTLTAPTPTSQTTVNQQFNQINAQEYVFKMLPPEAREALKVLMSNDEPEPEPLTIENGGTSYLTTTSTDS